MMQAADKLRERVGHVSNLTQRDITSAWARRGSGEELAMSSPGASSFAGSSGGALVADASAAGRHHQMYHPR